MNPQPDWQELAIYYSEDYDPYEPSHGSAAKDDEQAATLAKQSGELRHLPIPTGQRLLDVGCGAGWFLRIAKRLGAEVKGIEPSAVGAARARLAGLDVYQGTLEDYLQGEGRNDRFDVITANHVIEHAPNPVATLHSMRVLLAPGGKVWVAVPNPTCWSGRKLLNFWDSVDLPYHLQQFTAKSMALAGSRAGLKLHRQYTYTLPAALASSLRLYWRTYFFVPRKLTQKISLIDRYFAPRFAAGLDRVGDGEAIITEFENHADSAEVKLL
jgi:2-polyprenyl-3-methyl-5-hydroxy-6-metoxy-1,4-benzoquinol methylase